MLIIFDWWTEQRRLFDWAASSHCILLPCILLPFVYTWQDGSWWWRGIIFRRRAQGRCVWRRVWWVLLRRAVGRVWPRAVLSKILALVGGSSSGQFTCLKICFRMPHSLGWAKGIDIVSELLSQGVLRVLMSLNRFQDVWFRRWPTIYFYVARKRALPGLKGTLVVREWRAVNRVPPTVQVVVLCTHVLSESRIL